MTTVTRPKSAKPPKSGCTVPLKSWPTRAAEKGAEGRRHETGHRGCRAGEIAHRLQADRREIGGDHGKHHEQDREERIGEGEGGRAAERLDEADRRDDGEQQHGGMRNTTHAEAAHQHAIGEVGDCNAACRRGESDRQPVAKAIDLPRGGVEIRGDDVGG